MQAYVTRTRLMGVVAGYIAYGEPETYEFYHVEFESFGLDRFDQLVSPTPSAVSRLKSEVMGGLGGAPVPVTPDQFLQLLVAAAAVNPGSEDLAAALKKSEWLAQRVVSPGSPANPLYQHFNSRHFTELMNACVEELRSAFEYIHYFLMRYLGQDNIYLRYVPQSYSYLDQRYTLMRNHLQRQDDDSYHFSALGLAEDYALIEGTIVIDEGIVEHFSVDVEKPLTELEASLLLKKAEYIYLYDVDDSAVETRLASENKALAINLYPRGRLYTCYRSHNDHVNAKTFFLNGDVEVYFYFTDSNQLLLVADDLRSLIKWDDYLENHFGEMVDKYEEWNFDSPILYSFIDSPFVDFDDFIASE